LAINAETLKVLIDRELNHVTDARVLENIRSLLVEPELELRDWDYGGPGEKYPCWTVLKHLASNTGIAYSESGFGPRSPWGLVWLGEEENRRSMGTDAGWHTCFLDAYFESCAATDLPIWSVFRETSSWPGERLTKEAAWDAAWSDVEKYRKEDPASRYYCHHCIAYERGRDA
jgi:hypothetical protein